jgi:hypothetical protein
MPYQIQLPLNNIYQPVMIPFQNGNNKLIYPPETRNFNPAMIQSSSTSSTSSVDPRNSFLSTPLGANTLYFTPSPQIPYTNSFIPSPQMSYDSASQQRQPQLAFSKANRLFVPLYCGMCRAYGCQCFYGQQTNSNNDYNTSMPSTPNNNIEQMKSPQLNHLDNDGHLNNQLTPEQLSFQFYKTQLNEAKPNGFIQSPTPAQCQMHAQGVVGNSLFSGLGQSAAKQNFSFNEQQVQQQYATAAYLNFLKVNNPNLNSASNNFILFNPENNKYMNDLKMLALNTRNPQIFPSFNNPNQQSAYFNLNQPSDTINQQPAASKEQSSASSNQSVDNQSSTSSSATCFSNYSNQIDKLNETFKASLDLNKPDSSNETISEHVKISEAANKEKLPAEQRYFIPFPHNQLQFINQPRPFQSSLVDDKINLAANNNLNIITYYQAGPPPLHATIPLQHVYHPHKQFQTSLNKPNIFKANQPHKNIPGGLNEQNGGLNNLASVPNLINVPTLSGYMTAANILKLRNANQLSFSGLQKNPLANPNVNLNNQMLSSFIPQFTINPIQNAVGNQQSSFANNSGRFKFVPYSEVLNSSSNISSPPIYQINTTNPLLFSALSKNQIHLNDNQQRIRNFKNYQNGLYANKNSNSNSSKSRTNQSQIPCRLGNSCKFKRENKCKYYHPITANLVNGVGANSTANSLKMEKLGLAAYSIDDSENGVDMTTVKENEQNASGESIEITNL